jgi:hypothetical protein
VTGSALSTEKTRNKGPKAIWEMLAGLPRLIFGAGLVGGGPTAIDDWSAPSSRRAPREEEGRHG